MKVHLWPSLLAAIAVMILAFFPDVGPQPFSSQSTVQASTSVKASPSHKKAIVMPLGDSITFGEGSTNFNGYRFALWQRLTAAGIPVTFVGSMHAGSMPFSESANEGHSGWRIAQISSHVVGWLQTYKPNYVLGTPEKVQKRDQEKLATCQQNGITLIQVPHWYKMDKQVIQELIRKYRPDVVNILP